MQYAIEVLGVEEIVVCGHLGCGGVVAALEGRRLGLIDNWLRHVQDVAHEHARLLATASRRSGQICSAGSTSSSRSRTSAARRSSRRPGAAGAG